MRLASAMTVHSRPAPSTRIAPAHLGRLCPRHLEPERDSPVTCLDLVERRAQFECSFVQHRDVVRDAFDLVQQVRREDHGAALVGNRPYDRFKNVAAHDGVEPRAGLVKDQQIRTMGLSRDQAQSARCPLDSVLTRALTSRLNCLSNCSAYVVSHRG